MADIEFQRRGRPLWVFVLLVLLLVIGGYYAWTSCAVLHRNGTLEPRGQPQPGGQAPTAPAR